jgi:hypothetical protein
MAVSDVRVTFDERAIRSTLAWPTMIWPPLLPRSTWSNGRRLTRTAGRAKGSPVTEVRSF